MQFGKRLSDLLCQRNLSQKELAIRANTTEATVSRYLNLERTPQVEIVISIAKALNVTTDYLLGVTDNPTVCGDNSSEASELLRCYSCSTNDEKRIVWAVLGKYASELPMAAFGQSVSDKATDQKRQAVIKAYENT